MPRAIEEAGGIPVKLPNHEWSGRGEEWLIKLTMIGRELRRRGISKLALHDVTRLIRSRDYRSRHSIWKHAQPTDGELKEAIEAVGTGIQILFVMDPDASPDEIHDAMIEEGKMIKGHHGGKPIKDKVRYKAKWKPVAIKYKQENPDATLEEIAAHISYLSSKRISYVSIWNWLNGG